MGGPRQDAVGCRTIAGPFDPSTCDALGREEARNRGNTRVSGGRMMRAQCWIAIAACGVLAAAGCARGRTGGTGGAPARNGAVEPIAFPEKCRAKPSEGGDAPWHWHRSGDCVAARAVDGGFVVLEHHTLRRRSPGGETRWEVDLRDADGKMCGYPAGLAIAADGSVSVGCGYSLLAFGPDGRRRWQIWPAGNTHVGAPVVDDAGLIYVVAGGTLHAIDRAGETIWRAGGGPRSASAIGVTPEGHFVLDTTEDAWFGDDGTVYHPDPDPTIVIFDRGGRLIEERRHHGSGPWPAWIPIVDEGGGRLPPR